jgi:heme/copper-type cytochrome/quinol oxidase subunit 2
MLKKILLSISIALAAAMPLAFAASAYAAEGIQQNLCAGANLNVNTDCNSGGITDAQAQQRINDILHSIINLFSLVVGIVSVMMIIYGGLKYITSGGDSGNVGNAKNTILYAIIGIVIVALAQFIVRFVLTKVAQ